MRKIREDRLQLINKIFPNLKEDLRTAQMDTDVSSYLNKCVMLSSIVALNIIVLFTFILLSAGAIWLIFPIAGFAWVGMFYLVVTAIPKINMARVRTDIESDIFIPSRMLLTLLESGNSLVTAIEAVSYTKAKSSKYFGKISSEIYLGKNVEQAIDDAIEYTPSDSFRMVLEPIKKSLKTGTDIQKTLLSTLQELQQQKVVEIEQYEKKLNPLSMFYMIFGTIIPAIGCVGFVILLAVLGIRITFFPTLFILLVLVLLIQLLFINIFQGTRPLVKL